MPQIDLDIKLPMFGRFDAPVSGSSSLEVTNESTRLFAIFAMNADCDLFDTATGDMIMTVGQNPLVLNIPIVFAGGISIKSTSAIVESAVNMQWQAGRNA